MLPCGFFLFKFLKKTFVIYFIFISGGVQCGDPADFDSGTFQFCKNPSKADSSCTSNGVKPKLLQFLSLDFLDFDCKIRPDICHSDATCTKMRTYKSKYNACVCNEGFIGNGIECIEEPSDCKEVCCNQDALSFLKDYCQCQNAGYNCCDCEDLTVYSVCGARNIFEDAFGYYTNIGPDTNGFSIFQKDTSSNDEDLIQMIQENNKWILKTEFQEVFLKSQTGSICPSNETVWEYLTSNGVSKSSHV